VTRENVSRGFGYVQFDKKENATAAIEKLNNSTQFGKEINAIIHSKKNEREDAGEHFTNLYVKNIPTNYSEENVKQLFGEFGEVVSVALKGNGTDIAFVTYKTHEQAAAAIDALDSKREVEGRVIFVSKFISQNEQHANS